MGIIYYQFTDSAQLKKVYQITGSMTGFEEVVNDLYISLVNPQTKEALPKVRLILDRTNQKSTFLAVEDLLYGPANPYPENEPLKISTLGNLTKEQVKKIILLGDTVVLNIASEQNQNNQAVASMLSIRRFGGKSIVEQETGIKIF